ncbi:MAG: hypothetical protein GX853_01445 [Chloroflexi bacterium]|nr:hypothetical protein [Chloroflexota bacterium]
MKRKTIITVLLIVVLSLSVLSACNNELDNDVKDPTNGLDPNSEPVSSLTIPSPTDDLAVVHGRIVDEETGKAPQNSVYLAENVTAGKPDLPAYLSFSHMSSPKAEVDENGFFYFKDVPKGEYAIMLFVPGGNPILIDNGITYDTMDYLWVNAAPNEALDMGTIYVP